MIKQGIQTNFPDERIQKWGCYFLCLVKWAQTITKEDFPVSRICAERNEAERNKYLDDEMTVLNAPELLNQLTRSKEFFACTRQATEPCEDRYIVCLKKPGYTHFIFIHNGQKWDPLDPDRPAAAEYEIDSYRIIV